MVCGGNGFLGNVDVARLASSLANIILPQVRGYANLPSVEAGT